MYETIQTPFNYGGLTLKNRIIFAPTTFGLSDEDYFEKITPDRSWWLRYDHCRRRSGWKKSFRKNHFLTKKALSFYEKVIGIAHDNDV